MIVEKIVAIVAAFTMLITSAANEKKTELEKDFQKTAQQITEDMGNGINLGNTMEAWGSLLGEDATVLDFEHCWGQPTTTQEIIDGMKAAGFDTVRIPVAWSNIISDDGKYTIDESYLKRVGEIIDYVLNDDMYAIVNIHWDGGWWEDFGSRDQTIRDNAMKKYKAMWTQIADYYKDYSAKLVFESANEELGDTSKQGQSPNEGYNIVNAANQAFVDIVRSSGGFNSMRYLLIAGYSTDIVKTCDSRFVMPTDTIKNHLIVSVHYYTPSTYCIADNEGNSWGYMDEWGSKEDIAEMRSYFEQMKKFTDEGYGVIVGEFGVTKKKVNNSYETKEGTAKFYKNVVKICGELGYCPILWNTGDTYIKAECKITDSEIAAVFKR